jgi:short-subunit dehydrogenase
MNFNLPLTKKIIIIGSSSGIGKELALMYAKQGHLVAITGRRGNLLQEIKDQYPKNIITAVFDVMENENLYHLNSLIQQLSGLDLLIYNAGYGEPSLELIPENEKKITQTNVNGFVEIVNYVFNFFVVQGYGHIAATSSLSALRGNSWSPAYSASKAFMSNYAEGLNIKGRKLKKDIVVTDIKAGFIATKMAKAHKQFWVAPVKKAVQQIAKAIEQKKRVVYITKRWWLIAQLMRIIPYSLYRRMA